MWATAKLSFNGEVELKQVLFAQLLAPTVYFGSQNNQANHNLILLPSNKDVLFSVSKLQTWEVKKDNPQKCVLVRKFKVKNRGCKEIHVGKEKISKGQHSGWMKCGQTVTIRISLSKQTYAQSCCMATELEVHSEM